MSGLGKKRQVFGSGNAALYLDSMSKAALADLVVDLLRRGDGEGEVDGDELGRLASEAMAPVARARGDRFVSYDAFVARRAARRAEMEAERARYARTEEKS